MADSQTRGWRRLVSLLSLLSALVLVTAGFTYSGAVLADDPPIPAPQWEPGELLATLDYAGVQYSFISEQQSTVRYKDYWGKSPEISCSGGVQLANGQVIVAGTADIRNNRFVMWLYPTDTRLYMTYPNILTGSSPPGGWNSDKGRWDPTKMCVLIHEQNNGSWRVKYMFTSYTRDDDWLLALLDTGITIVATPTP